MTPRLSVENDILFTPPNCLISFYWSLDVRLVVINRIFVLWQKMKKQKLVKLNNKKGIELKNAFIYWPKEAIHG